MTRVKICGIRRAEHALLAAEAGADYLGFMFYRGSRRYTDPEVAAEIIASVRGRAEIRVAGVFVNAEPDEMNRIARLAGLDLIQLAGDEPDDVILSLDVPAIQVIHVHEETTPEVVAERLLGTPAEVAMLDTGSTGTYGGTGRTFDWERVPRFSRPYLLAGGLHPGNVADAVLRLQPWGVDVSSGVETNGEKDPERIRDFIHTVKGRDG